MAVAESPGKFTVQNGVNFVPPSVFGDLSGLSFLYEVEALGLGLGLGLAIIS